MTWVRVTVIVAAFLVSGCAAAGAPEVGSRPEGSGGLHVQVENRTTSSVRIYAMVRGDETLIGRVDALGTRSLRLPGVAEGLIRLVARPSATAESHRRHVSEPIHLTRGQRVSWQLRASPGVSVPRLSTVRVLACDGSC